MQSVVDVIQEQYSSFSPLLLITVLLAILLVIELVIKLKPKLKPRTIRRIIIAENKKNIGTSWLKKLAVTYYLPSWQSFLLLTIAAGLAFFVGSHVGVSDSDLLQSNRMQNIIAILAGLGVIVFAFLIFVAEQTRENRDHARVLLRQGLIFPLSALYVILIVLFLYAGLRPSITYIVLLLGAFVLWSISRLFRVLFEEGLLESKTQEYVRDEYIRKDLVTNILSRLNKVKFIEYLDNSKYKIDYNPFRDDEGLQLKVKSRKGQMVYDVNLDQLDKMLGELDKRLLEKGYTILKEPKIKVETKKSSKAASTKAPKLSSAKTEQLKIIEIAVVRLIEDRLGPDAVVITVNNRQLDDDISKLLSGIISSCIPRIFKIKNSPSNKNVLRLIELQQEDASIAIANRANIPLEQALSTYETVVESFSELLIPHGSYSREEALKERNSFMERWDFLESLGDNYRDLMEEAVNVGNFKAVTTIARSAYKVLRDSVDFQNHLIFLQMIYFIIQFYNYGTRSDNADIKNYLQDRSSRYMDEIASYKISGLIRGANPDEYNQYKDFVLDVLQAYLQLLRQNIDAADVEGFNNAVRGQRSVIERINRGYDFSTSHYEDEEIEKLITTISSDLQQKSNEIIFGVATWALHKAKKANFSEADRNSVLLTTLGYLSNSVEELTQLLADLSKGNAPDSWGWSTWSLPMDGEMHSVDDETPLVTIYLLKILQIGPSSLNLEAIKRVLEGYGEDDDAVYQIQSMFKKLKSVLEQDNQWMKDLFDEEKYNQLPSLIPVADSVLVAVEETFAKIIAERPISSSKVTEFKKDLHAKYKEHKQFEELLKRYKAYKNEAAFDSSSKEYGIYQIDHKEVFFDKWYSGFAQWGQSYGEKVAGAEERLFFGFISGKLTKVESEHGEVVAAIQSALNDEQVEKTEVILTNMHDFELEDINWGDYGFEPRSYQDRQGRHFADLKVGRRRIPMYHAYNTADPDFIALVNLSNSFRITRSQPNKDEKDEDNLRVEVTDFNADDSARQSLMEANPQWLQSKANPEFFLRQKVQISVYTRVAQKLTTNKEPGRMITVKPRPTN